MFKSNEINSNSIHCLPFTFSILFFLKKNKFLKKILLIVIFIE